MKILNESGKIENCHHGIPKNACGADCCMRVPPSCDNNVACPFCGSISTPDRKLNTDKLTLANIEKVHKQIMGGIKKYEKTNKTIYNKN